MKIQNKLKVSTKHLLIDKNNTIILYSAAITAAIVMFSIFAASSLVKQINYHNKVIGIRDRANRQLQDNVTAAASVVSAYKQFENASESSIGTADKNSKIILDALPSKYDFPALATSLEALVRDSGATLSNIGGSDNEATAEQNSINPKPIDIPFQIVATGSLDSIKLLVNKIEHSIRPIQILSISLSASGTSIQANISAKTFYQPEKLLNITQLIVNQKGVLQSATTTNKNEAKK